MSNSDTRRATTPEEIAECLADMADAEYGKLVNFDVSFSLARRLIEDVERLSSELAARDAELESHQLALLQVRQALDLHRDSQDSLVEVAAQSRAQVARLREAVQHWIDYINDRDKNGPGRRSVERPLVHKHEEMLATLPDQSARDAEVLRAAEKNGR